MDVRLSTTCTLCGLALLVSSGCQNYSPYGTQYGYPPGAYGAPPPGGYVTPGTNGYGTGGAPTPADGNLGQPAPLGNGGGLKAPNPNPGPTTLRNTPPANSGTGGRLPSEDPVPFPKEASGIPAQPTGATTTVKPAPDMGTPFPGGGAPAPFDAGPTPMGTVPMGTTPAGTAPAPGAAPAPGTTPSGKSDLSNPFGDPKASNDTPGTNVKLIGGEAPAPTGEPARFQPPAEVKPVDWSKSNDKGAPAPGTTGTDGKSSALNPYDYDSEKYTWLRGKVDFDQETKTWQIIYAPKPDLADKYGGTFLLIDNPKLKDLRDHDIVLLEGQPDLGNGGKPRYRIKQMFGPLVPKAQARSTPAISPEFPGTGSQGKVVAN